MNSSLRTEIWALLEEEPPAKIAPANTYAFALVLVNLPPASGRRSLSVICRTCDLSEQEAEKLVSQPTPIELKRGMCYSDAAIGQFELLACDALSFIVPDRVLDDPLPGYLAELYKSLAASSDFQFVAASVTSLPAGPKALEFLNLFFGDVTTDASVPRIVMRRKALLMKIMADRIGGQICIEDS